ncbi:alpha/beta hydrolase family protein [Parvibium lacunae]|uniref:Dienelactone hydrolase n=1 Tax=Parvibium lacunae TaxID=1888893 RepID=A0A368KYH4_9BURK|nr:CocE/NonD family hydrolase [Parvibium lacunae]RCS56483.1 dienelactone hydrolase [Parvibium lacunae]
MRDSAGSFAVMDDVWRDSLRQREIPIRLRLPQHASTPVPLIVFSHGLGGSLASGSFWLDHWAAQGFATLNVQHPGSDLNIWSRRRDSGELNLRERLHAAMQPHELQQRTLDVKFVLDELHVRQASTPTLQPLDLNRIAMSGHSYGAVTTLALCGQHYPHLPAFAASSAPSTLFESRFKAALVFSPSARHTAQLDEQFGQITLPCFCLTGTHDQIRIAPDITPDNRQLPFRHMRGNNKAMLVLAGADHLFFNGRSRQDSAAECGMSAFKEVDNSVDAALIPVVQETTLGFWLDTIGHAQPMHNAIRWGFIGTHISPPHQLTLSV